MCYLHVTHPACGTARQHACWSKFNTILITVTWATQYTNWIAKLVSQIRWSSWPAYGTGRRRMLRCWRRQSMRCWSDYNARGQLWSRATMSWRHGRTPIGALAGSLHWSSSGWCSSCWCPTAASCASRMSNRAWSFSLLFWSYASPAFASPSTASSRWPLAATQRSSCAAHSTATTTRCWVSYSISPAMSMLRNPKRASSANCYVQLASIDLWLMSVWAQRSGEWILFLYLSLS